MDRVRLVATIFACVMVSAVVTIGVVVSQPVTSVDYTSPEKVAVATSLDIGNTAVRDDIASEIGETLPEITETADEIEESNPEVLGVSTVNRNISTNSSALIKKTTPAPKTSIKKKPSTPVKKKPSTPTPTPPPPPPPPPSSGNPTGTSKSVEITYYGSYDNDPPGSRAISNPVIHSQAGGVGSYADPLTFASPTGPGAYAVGTIIYVPSVRKYFIKEDICATSWTAPNGCGPVSHVDLYMGNPSNSSAVIACEEALTPNGNATIIVNPSSNWPYDPTPLWNQSTGQCMTPYR